MTTSTSDPVPDSRQRLLMAAILVFAEKGYDGAGIREIAQRAKANSALVQYYFGSKEGLYTATLQFLFEQGPNSVGALPPPPVPGEPDALRKAEESLRGYIRAFLEDLFACHGSEHCSEEMHGAIHLFWTRELLKPALDRAEMLLAHIQPNVDYLDGCLRILRSDLDEEALFLMGCSIHSQIMFFHRDMALIALLRKKAFGPEDLDRLTNHIAEFSLGGLGLKRSNPGA